MKDRPKLSKSVKIFYCSLPMAYGTRTLCRRASNFDIFKRNLTCIYHELLEDYLFHAAPFLPPNFFSITCFINACVLFLFCYLLTSKSILAITYVKQKLSNIFKETQWRCDNSTCFTLSLPLCWYKHLFLVFCKLF